MSNATQTIIMCDSKQDTRHTMYYDTTRQTSSMQNGDRQVGHGHRPVSYTHLTLPTILRV